MKKDITDFDKLRECHRISRLVTGIYSSGHGAEIVIRVKYLPLETIANTIIIGGVECAAIITFASDYCFGAEGDDWNKRLRIKNRAGFVELTSADE